MREKPCPQDLVQNYTFCYEYNGIRSFEQETCSINEFLEQHAGAKLLHVFPARYDLMGSGQTSKEHFQAYCRQYGLTPDMYMATVNIPRPNGRVEEHCIYDICPWNRKYKVLLQNVETHSYMKATPEFVLRLLDA